MEVSNEQIGQPINLIGGILVLQPLQVLGQLSGALPGRPDVVAERLVVIIIEVDGPGRGAPVVMQPERAEIELLLLLLLEDLEEE